MQEIDPQFRQMGKGARKRRLRVGLIRGVPVLLALMLAGAVGWHYIGPLEHLRQVDADIDQTMTPIEAEFDIAPVVRGDTFTDIPGDPMIIETGSGAQDGGRKIAGPSDLSTTRVGTPGPDRLTLVREDLYVRERRLVAALPTTREDFALFQAERSREKLFNASADPSAPVDEGFSLPRTESGQLTSSVIFTREARTRTPLWQDLLLQIRLPTDIATLLTDNGFDRVMAERVKSRVIEVLGIKPELPRGSLLGVRYRMIAGQREVLQLTLYDNGNFVGSLGVGASGQLVSAADPWADQPLLDQSVEEEASGDAPQFRLLDVIYTAAIRQGVPSTVIGEAIALMSKVYDLDSFAAQGDRLQLLYATNPGPGADAAGQVLFVGVTGPSGVKSCYVVPQRDGGFDCYAPGARVAAVTDQPAMITPVAGVLSRRFVAAKKSEPQSGTVAWQAAQGSIVAVVASGTVSEVAKAASGVTVVIDHEGGLRSVYHGLTGLPAGIAKGAEIKRGGAVGRVAGEAGLVFQMLKDGVPVDPIPYLTGGNEVLASSAVEALIGRIIHVESAGNAAAKNPLSTATGLGQFIESTWLRMMNTYRPDLVATMSRQQLLDLRLESALSRQMVRNLAQENEAFLRARGHSASAGNLYLAHFLGPMGAAQVLSADPAASVGDVMGAGVVNANPFLRGYNIADLRLWADRKMNAKAVAAATSLPVAQVQKATPEVERFVALMDGLLASSQN